MTYITEESQPVTVGSAAKLIPHMTGTWCTAFRSVADPIKEMYYFTAILSQLSKHKRGQKWTQENSKQVTGKFGNLKTGSWECANNIYLHMWVVLQFTTSRRTRCGTLLKRWCVDLPIATLIVNDEVYVLQVYVSKVVIPRLSMNTGRKDFMTPSVALSEVRKSQNLHNPAH